MSRRAETLVAAWVLVAVFCYLYLLFICLLSSPPITSLPSPPPLPLPLKRKTLLSPRKKKIGERECIPLGGGEEKRRRGKGGEKEERRGVCLSLFCAVSICMHISHIHIHVLILRVPCMVYTHMRVQYGCTRICTSTCTWCTRCP